MVALLSISIAVSLFINVFLFLIILRTKDKIKNRPQSYEVGDLLNDLLAGKSLIEVKRISPVDVFIKSPRQ